MSIRVNTYTRWQSDDSELFFSFYKYYHTTLNTYIAASYDNGDDNNDNILLTKLPGYMYLATYFSGKIGSLIQRQVLSVTNVTQSTMQKSITAAAIINETNAFNSVVQCENSQMDNQNERLHFSVFQSGKPKPLEIATRRYAECLLKCITTTDLYSGMLNVWLRAAINKTRLTEAEQVYCKYYKYKMCT